MLDVLKKAVRIPEIREKIVFTFIMLFVFRFLAHIPVPNVDLLALRTLLESNQIFSFLNIFTGGGLQNLSVVAVGISPYISASILVQLLTFAVPKFEELTKEGAYGIAKLKQYTQWLTFPIAIVQSYGLYFLITKQSQTGSLIYNANVFELAVMITTLVAGTYLLLWISTLITEHGIGNGVSLIVFAGILSGLYPSIAGTFAVLDQAQIFNIMIFSALSIVVIYLVVYINEAYRRIQVQYSSRSADMGSKSYIPIKINQAGVIPIIFAVTLIFLPGTLGTYLQSSQNVLLSDIGIFLVTNFGPSAYLYNLTYFFLVFAFTYFYTSITFDPNKMADDIRRSGGFILGVRPGVPTAHYLKYIIRRLTLAGGVFLGLVAVLPSVLQGMTGITTLAIGGTGILIVVSVVLETVKQIEAQVITREYEKFYS